MHVSVRLFGIFLKSSFFRVCKFYLFLSTFGLFLLQFSICFLHKYLLQRSFKNDLIEDSFPREFLKIKTLEIVSDLQGLKGCTIRDAPPLSSGGLRPNPLSGSHIILRSTQAKRIGKTYPFCLVHHKEFESLASGSVVARILFF